MFQGQRETVWSQVMGLLAFDAMFQITLIAALFSSQSNQRGCQNWWSPFTLSAIVSVATSAIIIHTLSPHLKQVAQMDPEKGLPIHATPTRHAYSFYFREIWLPAALAFLYIVFSVVALISCISLLC
eukprot:Gb_03880 [translate_table: standard]